jgi:hypothetical protein
VWTRGRVTATQCPKSIVSAQSAGFLDRFAIWKELGGGSVFDLDAKTAEALLLLQQEWELEKQNVQH